jgi:Tfp pilus assembly protein PilF
LAEYVANPPDLQTSDPVRAKELVAKALEVDPQRAPSYATMGMAHYRAGEFDAARALLEKAVKQNDEDVVAASRFFLAMVHWQLGNQEEARQLYKLAAEWLDQNKPAEASLHRYRAEAAKLLGIGDQVSP